MIMMTTPVTPIMVNMLLSAASFMSVVNGAGGAVTNTTDANNAPVDVASYSG